MANATFVKVGAAPRDTVAAFELGVPVVERVVKAIFSIEIQRPLFGPGSNLVWCWEHHGINIYTIDTRSYRVKLSCVVEYSNRYEERVQETEYEENE